MHYPGGNDNDPIWRALASSDGISSWTPLKPLQSNPNPNTLANQLWCIDFLTPPTPVIIPHRLPAFLESLMPLWVYGGLFNKQFHYASSVGKNKNCLQLYFFQGTQLWFHFSLRMLSEWLSLLNGSSSLSKIQFVSLPYTVFSTLTRSIKSIFRLFVNFFDYLFYANFIWLHFSDATNLMTVKGLKQGVLWLIFSHIQ